MATPVLTTFVAHFEGSEEAAASFEFWHSPDDTLNPEEGVIPGQYWYFLLKIGGPVYIDRVRCTNGTLNLMGTSQSRSRTERCLFVELNSENDGPSISMPPSGGFSPYWYGNVGSGLHLQSDRTLDITGGSVPCVADITYNTTWDYLYRLNPGDITWKDDETTTYDIYIVVYIKEIVS